MLKKLPEFYQDVLTCFNKAKDIKPLELLNKHELLQEMLFGNENFKQDDKCLYFRNWLRSGIYRVKHLVSEDGHRLTDEQLYNKIITKQNVLGEMFMMKKILSKHLKSCDLKLACYINEKKELRILHRNKHYVIMDNNSKFFYNIIKDTVCERNYMEFTWSTLFGFSNSTDIWNSIYRQKVTDCYIKKLAEFSFKILHNILPCGQSLSKWEKDISPNCEYCNLTETPEHMLFSCKRVKAIWLKISDKLHMDVRWKHLVCGFIKRHDSTKIQFYNLILTLIMYAIFRKNSKSKFEKRSYLNINLNIEVKTYLIYYKNILLATSYQMMLNDIFDDIIDCL